MRSQPAASVCSCGAVSNRVLEASELGGESWGPLVMSAPGAGRGLAASASGPGQQSDPQGHAVQDNLLW